MKFRGVSEVEVRVTIFGLEEIKELGSWDVG